MAWKRRRRAVGPPTPPHGLQLDGPNPVPVPLTHLHPIPVPGARHENDTSPLRKIFCIHYAACLDVAAREGWDDFTCHRCPLAKDAAEPTAASMAEDRPGTREQ